ncbi:hypothetical protein SBRCBS47491_002466 [Sporothrix bragantina]|uniref:Zn(2)-C6 fungal-type domain-containing protein n=1 Tax=Sporothrix bragantina TaxID=671064 RepID=A0ABP0B749_9PEZI
MDHPPPPTIIKKRRTRAAVACNHCRVKRSKCDGAVVGTPCTPCSKHGLPSCELRQDRKRQRPASGAVLVDDLTARVQQLERLLNIQNKTAPTTESESHDKTTAPEDSDPDFSFAETSFLDSLGDAGTFDGFDLIPPEEELFHWEGFESMESMESMGSMDTLETMEAMESMQKQTKRRRPSDAEAMPPPSRAVQTPRLSLGNTMTTTTSTTSPVFVTGFSPSSSAAAAPDTLVDSLLDLYFTQFQTMLKIVDQATFQRERGASTCRESLVLAMMAAGARFADLDLLGAEYRVHSSGSSGSGETVFARRSKQLLESEVGQADLATVQALLILGELETAAGHDMSGCMYSGLVARLIFDLRLDPASSQEMAVAHTLTDADRSVRHWLLWYASVQDKYWAQRLGRPLTIKNMELQLSRMIAKFAQSSHDEPAKPVTPSPDTVIEECVLDLLELTREALEFLVGASPRGVRVSVESYATVARILAKLDQWFRQLPSIVKDNPGNSNKTNHFVPVLHMQYHLTKIQLVSPFAFGAHTSAMVMSSSPASMSTASPTSSTSPINHIAARCRVLGASSAVAIAKLFATFRRTYDIRCLQCSGVQYAETAALFLVKYIPLLQTDELVEPEAHLRSLARTLAVMQETFRPAKPPLDEVTAALEALHERGQQEAQEERQRSRSDTSKDLSRSRLSTSGVSLLSAETPGYLY